MTERGLLFDLVAEEYDRARPAYPDPLVDKACAIAGLKPGSRVAEVGCGTGKLTSALVERGLQVEAIDPGESLLAVARRNVDSPLVHFHAGRFEDVELPPASFDAVFSATAFHWVHPAVGWTKVARLLRPEGVLALLAYVGGSVLELDDRFRQAWSEVLPEATGWQSRDAQTLWAGAEERRGNVSEVWAWLEKSEIARPEAAELYDDVQIDTVLIEQEETAHEALALIRTTSAYLLLDGERRAMLEERYIELIEGAGGVQRSTSYATLITARVRSDA